MEIHVIASGSKGNCTFVKTETRNILIDVGISYSRIKSELELRQFSISCVDTILLTHEHTDHTLGLDTLLKKENIAGVFLTNGTHKGLKPKLTINRITKIIKADETYYLDNLAITPIMLSHDANEPVGFVLVENEKKFVYITDTGFVDKSYLDLLKNADIYVLESNHHPFMLMNSKRTFQLKRRILGEKGHLSNEDAMWLINNLVENKRTIWVVAHISEECNNILEIEKELVKGLKKPELIDVYYATIKGIKGITI